MSSWLSNIEKHNLQRNQLCVVPEWALPTTSGSKSVQELQPRRTPTRKRYRFLLALQRWFVSIGKGATKLHGMPEKQVHRPIQTNRVQIMFQWTNDKEQRSNILFTMRSGAVHEQCIEMCRLYCWQIHQTRWSIPLCQLYHCTNVDCSCYILHQM